MAYAQHKHPDGTRFDKHTHEKILKSFFVMLKSSFSSGFSFENEFFIIVVSTQLAEVQTTLIKYADRLNIPKLVSLKMLECELGIESNWMLEICLHFMMPDISCLFFAQCQVCCVHPLLLLNIFVCGMERKKITDDTKNVCRAIDVMETR